MISENPYMPIPAKLVEVIAETPTIKTLVLAPERPMPFAAGQFVQLGIPGLAEAPFTPSSSPLEPERIAITILKTGTLTDRLHECKAGMTLGLRGPFGKGYPVDAMDGKEALVVGGGVALMGEAYLAPLRAAVAKNVFDLYAHNFQIVSAKLGEDAVLVGALLI